MRLGRSALTPEELDELKAFLAETEAKMASLAQERRILDAANLLYDGYANLWRSDALTEYARLLDPGGLRDYVVGFFGKRRPRAYRCLTAFHAASEAERWISAKAQCVYVDRLPFLWRRTLPEGLYYTPIDGLPSDP